MVKVIKSQSEYGAALAEIEQLIRRDPDSETSDAEKLELLTLIVQNYEESSYQTSMPSPLEAIKFRMEQQNLTPRDLVPYIGSRSKVSEILSGKRTLTISMMRALHKGLGIPAKVLLQDQPGIDLEETDIEWERFPILEMIKIGWIKERTAEVRDRAEEIMRRFLASLPSSKRLIPLYRQTDSVRAARGMDRYALFAWTARIVMRALSEPLTVTYRKNTVNMEFMREVARLSWSEHGPVLAKEFLEKHGIALIIERHLSRTHLDGAAILYGERRPIIGLSIRHDRLDNFWFCLMHELAHVALHLGGEFTHFYDDLDVESQENALEKEADAMASEALIPTDIWEKSAVSRLRTPQAAQRLAEELRVHPAIVVGRVRKLSRDFRVLNQLVGSREVRKLFSDVAWS